MKRNDGAYEMTTNTCYDYVKRDSSTTNATALAKTAKSQRSCSKLTTVLVVGVCVNMLLTVCGLALAIFAIANQRNAPSLRLEDQMIPNMNGGLQLMTLSKLADDLNSTQLQVKQLMENVGAMFTAQSDINELVSRINMTGASQEPPGLPGVAGPVGPQGEKGDSGTIGAPGPAGAPGSIGPKGEMGIRGPTGLTGPQGPRGNTGAKGDPGIAGLRGIQGVAGQTGSPGAKGQKGARGSAGSTGSRGQKGAKGSSGPPGPIGIPGFCRSCNGGIIP